VKERLIACNAIGKIRCITVKGSISKILLKELKALEVLFFVADGESWGAKKGEGFEVQRAAPSVPIPDGAGWRFVDESEIWVQRDCREWVLDFFWEMETPAPQITIVNKLHTFRV